MRKCSTCGLYKDSTNTCPAYQRNPNIHDMMYKMKKTIEDKSQPYFLRTYFERELEYQKRKIIMGLLDME